MINPCQIRRVMKDDLNLDKTRLCGVEKTGRPEPKVDPIPKLKGAV